MEIIFWVLVTLVFYAYFGYPSLLWVVSHLVRKPIQKKPCEPTVSVILSAFNEEKNIEQKLENLLSLDYPDNKLEILVGSDGASDETDKIVSRFHSPRIRFFRFVKNLGKPNVINALVKEARGAILLFTDARQPLDSQAVRELIANFSDLSVGSVSGELYFRGEGEGQVARGMGAYWRYEKFLRRCESEIGSMLGATGALYAVRKELVPELPQDILVDDMYIPLAITLKGFRAIFESAARIYDQPSTKSREEFVRKVRTLTGNYQIFYYFPNLFIPFQSPIAWQFFSHKFLRLVVPFCLVGIFLINLFLIGSVFYRWLFVGQALFYGIALFEAWNVKRGARKSGIGYLPYMFCFLNYCALIAFFRFATHKQEAAWEKAYA
ncbi:MAG: glycosyltransferase family 2 protein [Candidatus Omnitrophica bacterium]|nr:glycosyltransferase family 2 protein [Candidatus Omnitrophota bacterium]